MKDLAHQVLDRKGRVVVVLNSSQVCVFWGWWESLLTDIKQTVFAWYDINWVSN